MTVDPNLLEELKKRGLSPGGGGKAAGTQAPSSTAPAQPRVGSYLGSFFDDLTDAAVQGVSLGFGEEIGAAGAATGATLRKLVGGESTNWGADYEAALARKRAQMADFAQKHPVASTAAMLAGGMALPVPGLRPGASAVGNIAKLGATGAVYGGAAGFGSGQGGLENRLENAGTGAALGGTIGVALPAAAKIVGNTARVAGRTLGAGFPARRALDETLRAMNRDRLTIPQVRANLAGTTKPMTLADQGRNLTRLARKVETIPSEGSDRVTEMLTARQAGQGERVAADVRGALGNVDYMGTFEALGDARSTAAQPLYEQAFQTGPVWNDRIQEFLNNPRIQEGIRRGMRIARDEALHQGTPLRLEDYAITGFDEAGNPILSGTPTLRLLDAAKRGLDDLLFEGEGLRDKLTGRFTQEGRAVEGIRASFVNELDRLTTDPATGRSVYADARAAWGGPSQSMEAMQNGRRFATGDAEVQGRDYMRLSPTDREFFKMGVVRQLEDTINKSDDGVNVVRKIFGSRDRRARLEMLFDNPGEFARFEQHMADESRMVRTHRGVTGGSITGRIAAEQSDPAADIATDLLHGGPQGVALGLMTRSINRVRGLDEPTANELARILITEDPGAQLGILNELTARQQRGNQVGLLGRSITAGGANVAGQLMARRQQSN